MTNHPPVTDFATDFDHTDPQWVADPYPIWDELREKCPGRAHRSLRRRVVAGHATTASPRSRTTPSTSRRAIVIVSEVRPGENDLPAPIGVAPPITSDPPFHALARRLLLPAFAPKPIAALEPFTRELCNELLDATRGQRHVRRRDRLRAAHPGAA